MSSRRGLDIALLRESTGLALRSTPVTMRHVLLALIPGVLLYASLIDVRVLSNLLVAVLAAMVFEAMALRLRARSIPAGLGDGSAAVTGALLAVSVPPGLPFWQLVFGAGVAILLAKHIYGGLGNNPFNPAMVAFAVLIVSFPVSMTHWPAAADPALLEATRLVSDTGQTWDGVTAQTPLDRHRELARDTASPATTARAITPGLSWSLIALGWLIGGLWLLWHRVISWHAPLSLLVTLAVCHAAAAVFSTAAMPPTLALLAGASVFGAFFIATDPVSGAATPRGRIIFGTGVALLTFAIRQFGSWPEGFAFAILIMNGSVPLIDRLDRPRKP